MICIFCTTVKQIKTKTKKLIDIFQLATLRIRQKQKTWVALNLVNKIWLYFTKIRKRVYYMLSHWGRACPHSFSLHQFRVEKRERQLDTRGKRGNRHCGWSFREESIENPKGSILLNLCPLISFLSFEYLAI